MYSIRSAGLFAERLTDLVGLYARPWSELGSGLVIRALTSVFRLCAHLLCGRSRMGNDWAATSLN
jgi:hypothetical protein